jgi:hypothetical protein
VTMRYDEVAGALDRALAMHVAQACLNWARDRVDAARAEPDSSSTNSV